MRSPDRFASPGQVLVRTGLAPLLEEFCRMHPGVQPEVELEDAIGDWVVERVDVGFRIGVHRRGRG